MFGMATQTITLKFNRGPLDGSERKAVVPAAWKALRYEHRPAAAGSDCAVLHVYCGIRAPAAAVAELDYIGAEAQT